MSIDADDRGVIGGEEAPVRPGRVRTAPTVTSHPSRSRSFVTLSAATSSLEGTAVAAFDLADS